MRNTKDVRDLLKERKVDYGDSWKVAGEVMSIMYRYVFARETTISSWYFHPIFMIVVKLCRILVTPTKTDHWRDIVGYATLVLDQLEGEDDLPSE